MEANITHSMCWHLVSAQKSPVILTVSLLVSRSLGHTFCFQESPHLRAWVPGEGRLPTPYPPKLAPGPPTHGVFLAHINLSRQDGHGGTAAGTLTGAGPEMLLAGIGAVLLQGAPGAAGHVRTQVSSLLPSLPGPAPAQGSHRVSRAHQPQ